MATCLGVWRWGDWVRFWVGWRYDFGKWSVVYGGVVLENDPKWFRLGLGKGSGGLFQGLSLGQPGLGSRLGG